MALLFGILIFVATFAAGWILAKYAGDSWNHLIVAIFWFWCLVSEKNHLALFILFYICIVWKVYEMLNSNDWRLGRNV